MNSIELLFLSLALIPYIATHAVIIAMLFHLRRHLPSPNRRVNRWLLVATAVPFVGPILSSVALARIARCYQAATADQPSFRSDCGHAAGIAYGLSYMAASWLSSAELGLLSLTFLGIFFWQAHAARRVLRNIGPTSTEIVTQAA